MGGWGKGVNRGLSWKHKKHACKRELNIMGVANIKYYLLQIFYAMKYILGGLPNIPAIRALRITGSSGIAIFNSLLHIFVADPILSRKENW